MHIRAEIPLKIEAMRPKCKMCPTCRGTGKIVIGYGATCMEPIEKVKKCPECKGKGYVQDR